MKNLVKKSLSFLALAIFAILICQPPSHQDFWHSAVGRHWCMYGPNTQQAISYILPEPQYRPYWGSQALWYIGSKLFFGIENLWIFSFILAIGLCFFCFRHIEGVEGKIWGLCFFLITTYPFWQIELNLIAIGLGILSYYFLTQIFSFKKNAWIGLSIIQILWCNSHPSFVIGFFTCFAYAMGQAFFYASNFQLHLKNKKEIIQYSSTFLLLPSVIVLFLSFLQPSFSWIIHIFQEFYFVSYPILYQFWPGYILLSIGYIYSIFRYPDLRKAEILVIAFWWIISLFWPVWSIATSTLILKEVSKIWMNSSILRPKYYKTFIACFSIILLLSFSILMRQEIINKRNIWQLENKIFSQLGKPWKNNIETEHIPITATQFALQLKDYGKIFHDPSLAKYLLWQGYNTIFSDERNIYPKSVLQEINQIRFNPTDMASILRRWDIQIIFLDHRISGSEELLSWLILEKNWNLVYCDPIVVIFLKSSVNPNIVSFIQKYQIHDQEYMAEENQHQQAPSNTSLLLQRCQAYFALRFFQRCQADINLIEKIEGKTADTYRIRGKIALFQQNWPEAIEYLENSWKLSQHPETLGLLIFGYLRSENLTKAKELAERKFSHSHATSFEKIPHAWIMLWFNQAQAFYLNKDLTHAQEFLAKILEFNPLMENARQFSQQIQKELSLYSVQHLLERSKKAIQEKQYLEAINLLKTVIQTDPRILDSYIELGKIYIHYLDYPKAAEMFRQALTLSPDNLLVNCKFSIALAGCGQWREALRIIEPLSQNYADRYEVREALFLVDDIAANSLLKELEKEFSFIKASQLSQIWARHDECQKAIQFWESIFSQIPAEYQEQAKIELAQLYYQESKLQLNQKNLSQGLSLLQKAIATNPNLFEAHLLLGTIALRKKDWLEARHYFSEMKRISPLDIRGLEGLALVELGQGLHLQLTRQYQDALAKFSQYMEQAPPGEDKQNISKWIANLQSSNKELLAKQKQDLETKAKIQSLFEQASLAMKQEHWEQAKKIWEEILNLDVSLIEARFNRVQCCLKLEQVTIAEDDLKNIIEQKPNWPDSYYVLGKLYYEQQNTEAKKYLELYLKLAPNGEYIGTVKAWLKILEIEKD